MCCRLVVIVNYKFLRECLVSVELIVSSSALEVGMRIDITERLSVTEGGKVCSSCVPLLGVNLVSISCL